MRIRALVFISLLLIVAVGLVSANSSGLPGAGWKSGQTIQNIDDVEVPMIMNAYDQAGVEYPCGSQVLKPGESYNILPENECTTMPAGFQGSAVVSSQGKMAAVVNVNNKPTGAASGQYVGTDGSATALSVVFPLVKNNHKGRTTTFYVQNASESVNTMDATFLVNGVSYPKQYANVPANAMVIITPDDAGVPSGNGNLGSLSVTGSQKLAGVSLEHEDAPVVADNMQASRGFTENDFDSTLYCPLVRYDFGSKLVTTGLQVQNVSGGPETINVTYKIERGPNAGNTIGPISKTVNNLESANFLQLEDLAAGDFGSATVTTQGGGNVVAVINDKARNSTPQRLTTYACFPGKSATKTISLPQAKEDFGGGVVNTTGIQIQNVGSAPTTVQLTYVTTEGDTIVVSHTDPIGVGQSKNFYRVALNQTSNQTLVSGSLSSLYKTLSGVTIVSLDDEPIVAMANESSLGSTKIQDTKNYEGFNK